MTDVTTNEPAEDPGDQVELTRTGWVRMTIGDRRYRLRRPMLGEIRDIRMSLEDMSDEIVALSTDALTASQALKAEQQSLAEADDTPDRNAQLIDLRRRDREAARALDAKTEQIRVDWWASVFAKLSPDGLPTEWPSWIVNPDLPGTVMRHWRAVPLAPG